MKKLRRKNYEYTAVFKLNENGGYTVTVPTLHGLTTEERTLEEGKQWPKMPSVATLKDSKRKEKRFPKREVLPMYVSA